MEQNVILKDLLIEKFKKLVDEAESTNKFEANIGLDNEPYFRYDFAVFKRREEGPIDIEINIGKVDIDEEYYIDLFFFKIKRTKPVIKYFIALFGDKTEITFEEYTHLKEYIENRYKILKQIDDNKRNEKLINKLKNI